MGCVPLIVSDPIYRAMKGQNALVSIEVDTVASEKERNDINPCYRFPHKGQRGGVVSASDSRSGDRRSSSSSSSIRSSNTTVVIVVVVMVVVVLVVIRELRLMTKVVVVEGKDKVLNAVEAQSDAEAASTHYLMRVQPQPQHVFKCSIWRAA
ncbi:hypothetical protein ElyMa_001910200 [Elysia marginata]|uniref:Uncharacterized protein n=1 Tax=Elysia marginata TaxID=1093978 RepID=A0AAV4ETP1_9GAST|nr:hypothetical protein ElyMa_001910200 [Elysia marginata]